MNNRWLWWRWHRQHGVKIIHRHRAGAFLHALQLNWRDRGWIYRTYSCRWGERYKDGETARRHWHAGHRKGPGPREIKVQRQVGRERA